MSLRPFLIPSVLVALLCISTPAFASTSSTFGDYTWKPLKIGAGGWLTGIDMTADGTKVVRADTYGAYIWDNSNQEWKQLVTKLSMPSADAGLSSGTGVYEIQIAQSNTSRFYMMYNGFVFRSDDKGAHWSHTAFAHVDDANSNGGYRYYGPKMAIDPINPDVVYVGTPHDGAWTTSNGGATWTQISSVPVSLLGGNSEYPGNIGIEITPALGTTGGKSNTIFIPSWGNGVWVSTDAGATWQKTVGGPTKVQSAAIGPDGYYYAVDGNYAVTDNAYRYASSTWTAMPGSSHENDLIAVDPGEAGHIVVSSQGGTVNVSSDHGNNWSSYFFQAYNPAEIGVFSATDVPWLGWTNNGYMSIGGLMFDPSATNKLYASAGIGVWHTTLGRTVSAFTWISQSAGIEQLVGWQVLVPPGGKPLALSWDRPVFKINDPDTYPSVHGPNRNNSIVMGWSADYAATNPNFIAGIFDWNGVQESSYSNDGGTTWTKFNGIPSLVASGRIGGSMAVSTPTNIVWAPSNNGPLYYTKDGGQTWIAPTIGNLPLDGSGESGWGWAYYFDRQVVTPDRTTTGVFYAYNYLVGVLKSIDGGATWTNVAGTLGSFTSYHAKLRSVPGKAGELFFTAGMIGGGDTEYPQPLFRSIDGGSTWSVVPNVAEVFDFGFGAPAPQATYPAIYIVGWVNHVFGAFRSDDNAQTWTQIGDYPLNSLAGMNAITGDPNIYGRVYVSLTGNGFAYGSLPGQQPTGQLPPIPIPDPTPTPTPPSSGGGGGGHSSKKTPKPVTPPKPAPTTATTTTATKPAPAPTTVPSSTAFKVGSTIQATANLNVRNSAAVLPANIQCKVPMGSTGTVKAGPMSGSGYVWWNVSFTSGCTGWVVQNYIGAPGTATVSKPISTTIPTPIPAPTRTTAAAPTTMYVPSRSGLFTGSGIRAITALNVRTSPSVLAANVICRQPAGVTGTLAGGPVTNQGYTWWYVSFNSGSCYYGWVVQDNLVKQGAVLGAYTGPTAAVPLKQTGSDIVSAKSDKARHGLPAKTPWLPNGSSH